MAVAKSTSSAFPLNQNDPATWLKPDEPLIGMDGRDWSWAYVWFKDIAGFPGYKVGFDGSAWSRKQRGYLSRAAGASQPVEWRRLTLGRHHGNYRKLQIWHAGRGWLFLIHRVVLAAFWGPCPPGMECCHNDGNPLNNRLTNLRWDTDAANQRDRERHGTSNRGSRNPAAKLDDAAVVEIYRQRRGGKPRHRVAAAFGVNQATVYDIEFGRTWRHVTSGLDLSTLAEIA